MDKLLSFKPSKGCGQETVIQSSSECNKGATVHPSTASKSCEQNAAANLIYIDNVRHDVKKYH